MLFFNELKKTFGKRTFLILAAVCFLSWLFITVSEKNRGYVFRAEDYKAIYERPEMNGTFDEAEEYIKSRDTGEITAEYFLISYVKSEINDISGYMDYREGIIASAERLSVLPIFSDASGFSRLNMAKTAEVYDRLPAIRTEPGPGRGVVMASGYTGSVIFAIVFMIYIIFSLVVREKEIGTLNLTRTTAKGHKPHGAAKLKVCMVSAVLTTVVLEGISWITAGMTYGLGNMSRPIQSVPEYRTCVFELSITGFMLVTVLFRAAFVVTVTVLVFFLACAFKTYPGMLLGMAAAAGTEGFLYLTVPGNSIWGLFKFINIFAGADTGFLLGDYINLNVFGRPVWYLPVYLGFLSVLLIVFSILGIMAYDRITGTAGQGPDRVRLSLIPSRSRSVFLQECHRYLFCEGVLLILAAFIIFRAVSFSPVREVFRMPEDIYYKQYMLQLEGMYSEEKTEEIKNERKKFESVTEEFRKSMEQASDETIRSLISAKFQDETRKYAVLDRVEAHAEYLKEKGGAFVYDAGYRILTNDDTGKKDNRLLSVMAALLMLICAVFMYAPDYQSGVDRIVKTTAKGRKSLFIRREVLGTVILLLTFLITYIPFLVSVLNAYGTSGFSYPACSLSHLNWVPAWISIRAYLVLLSIVRFVILWLEMNLVYLISTKVRSISYTLIIGAALFVVPLAFI